MISESTLTVSSGIELLEDLYLESARVPVSSISVPEGLRGDSWVDDLRLRAIETYFFFPKRANVACRKCSRTVGIV
jgi:hypothetical protein